MMSSGGGRKGAVPGGEEAEVEALLRAAQDAVMLKLQANSHLVSSAATAPSIDAAAAPDPPGRRPRPPLRCVKSHAPAPAPKPAGAGGGMEELAALKGAAGPEKETRVRLEDLGGESSEEEVDKLMLWAMDAARLDVATAAGKAEKAKRADEEEAAVRDEKSSVSSEDDEEERLELEMARKEMAKSRWFF